MNKWTRCLDCNLEYDDNFGADITLSYSQWELIFPEDNGLLCGTCLTRRVQKLPGIIAIRAVIEIAYPDMNAKKANPDLYESHKSIQGEIR